MVQPWTAWISSEDLDGLVRIEPEVSGLPVYLWTWTGGASRSEAPLVLVARGPSVVEHPVAVVQVLPEILVLTGPLIEAERWMPALAAWLDANASALARYWWHTRLIYWPSELLRDLRRADSGWSSMAIFHSDLADEEAVLIAEAYALWLESQDAVQRHDASIMRWMVADLHRRQVPRWRLGRATTTWISRIAGGTSRENG